MHMARSAVCAELDIEHTLGDDAAPTRACEARILNRMFEIEQHPRTGACVAFIHQHGTALQEIAVVLEGEVNHRIEQRVPWTDKGGQRLTLWRHERFFERDAFVSRQHRFRRCRSGGSRLRTKAGT